MELAKMPEATRAYVQDIQAEMKRVTWPSYKQVQGTTGVVIAAVFLFAAYFWVVNGIVNWIINVKLIPFLTK